MTSTKTLLLILTFFLVNASWAVTGKWISISSLTPGPADITANQSNTSSISLSIYLSGFYLDETSIAGKPYFIPRMENAFPLLSQGNPDLLKITAAFQIPASGEQEARILSSKYIDFTGYAIAPSAGNISRNETAGLPVFNNTYQKDEFFPGDLITSDAPFIIRNIRGQAFQVFPFQYNPATGVLRVYYDIQIEIVPTGGTGINPLTIRDQQISPLPDLAHSLLNSFFYPALKSGSLPSENGKMLIVCPSLFSDALKPFISWKNQTGISTEVVNAEQFTDASQILQFVKDYYYSSGNLTYLLLVGDAEQVPTNILPYGASDNVYSYLAGDDHYPDIFVGRFSANSVKDVQVQVKRTLQYEQNPGSNSEWLGEATGIASAMTGGDDSEADYQHIRNLLGSLKSFTYSGIHEFFDGSQAGTDAEGDPSTQSIVDQVNNGTGVILYTGHGSTSTWATGKITRTVVSNLDNIDKFPFIWSAACETGNFAGSTCLAEIWLRASTSDGEPLGAVAALMASGTQTTNPPMEGQDEMVNQLLKAGQGNAKRTFGGLSISGMLKMNDIYGDQGFPITDTWILFGDPSLAIRTTAPKTLKVTHDLTIGKGRNTYSLSTSSISGTACLSSGEKVIGTSLIVNGQSSINLDQPAYGDKLSLTVTSFNCLPYQAEIEVINIASQAGNCQPVNHSQRVSIAGHFNWDSGNGGIPDSYVFYLGTDNPPTNKINGISISTLSYSPAIPLEYSTRYYWRVDAINASGTTTGKVYEFTTIYGPDEDFENGLRSPVMWLSGGGNEWTIDQSKAFHGNNTSRSGKIGDGEYSSLIYPCEVTNCDFVGFWNRVSSEVNKDKLQFLIDGVVLGEWSGNQDWTYHSYNVEPGSHQLEWRYIKDENGSGGEDAAWLDDISLPVHAQIASEAVNGGSVCEGSTFIPDANAENYNSIQWKTGGNGTFDDNTLLEPNYMPGSQDLISGTVQLSMIVSGFDGCLQQISTISVSTIASPLINLPSDTIATEKSAMVLDASSFNAASYLWLPGNESTPSITVDTLGQLRGSKTLTLQLTNTNGCMVQKRINVHFPASTETTTFLVYPNPCNTSFTLESENGATMLNRVLLVNALGSKVWEQKGNIEIIDRQDFTIPPIADGSYYLVTENDSGRSVKPLIVHRL